MAKRFTSTEVWSEDWFLDMPNEYKLYWFYMLSACNHAGIFRVNSRVFSSLVEVKIDPNEASNHFNAGKQRVRKINDSTWLIEDFFTYQYGCSFNLNNRVHQSVLAEYEKLGIEISEIRGLNRSIIDLKERVKDKDKEKDSKDKGIVSKEAKPKKSNLEADREKMLFDSADEDEQKRFTRFKEWLKSDAPRVEQMKQPFSFSEWQKATAEFGKFGDTLIKMHNYQPLLKTNVSSYLTLCNWRRKDQNQ